MRKTFDRISAFLGSETFLFIVIGLFCLQALWVAFSFRYPMIFDEAFHFPVIKIQATQLSPFLTTQLPEWDKIGVLTTGSQGIYHYLMSFPYRLTVHITSNEAVLIIFLRVLNITMVAIGLWLYSHLLNMAGIHRRYINVGILLFSLLPLFVLVSAHISYDNMLFMLTPLVLIYAARLIKFKKVNWSDLAWFITIGSFTILVKFTFIPVMMIASAVVAAHIYKIHGRSYISKLKTSFVEDGRIKRYLILTSFVICLGLIGSNYLKNILVYHTIKPSCQQIISADRCSSNWVNLRAEKAKATKSQRKVDVASFSIGWFERMSFLGNTSSSTVGGARQSSFPPQAIKLLIIFGIVFGIGGILYAWSSLGKNNIWILLIAVSVGLILSVFLVNLNGYIKIHAQYANQARYNLSVIPILIVMSVVAYAYILRQHRWAKYALLTFVLIIFTQGGGAITHIIKSKDTWYWQNQRVLQANHAAKKILNPIIVEK